MQPFIVCLAWAVIGWIPLLGLKVLKPQEALVLTLFGNYIGTIREPGFYFVNPFCSALNPAAATKLAQSGDTISSRKMQRQIAAGDAAAAVETSTGKKISLKAMTLSNGRLG